MYKNFLIFFCVFSVNISFSCFQSNERPQDRTVGISPPQSSTPEMLSDAEYRGVLKNENIMLPEKIYRTIDGYRELIKVFTYDKDKLKRIYDYLPSGIANSIIFTYENNLITEVDYIEDSITDKIKLSYNDKGELIKKVLIYNRFDSMVTSIKYINDKDLLLNRQRFQPKRHRTQLINLSFQNNNLRQMTTNNGTTLTNFIYDDKHNPYVNIVGYNRKIDLAIEFWTDSKNNTLEEISKGSDRINYFKTNKFTYNKEGYPIRIEYSMRQGCIKCEPNTYIYEIEYQIFVD